MSEAKGEATRKTLKRIFGAELDADHPRYYEYGGYRQVKRKREFVEWSKTIEAERGIPTYNPGLGLPLGQRLLEPAVISGTDVVCDYEDVHHVTNAAIQQMVDDIKRTAIVGLDSPHWTLKKRLGKDVTPETINAYLETVNHTMPGGAVAQEHMAEIHPGLVKDCYVKVVTGDEELADKIDARFLLDIDKLFPKEAATKLKKAIGNKLYQVARLPTLALRNADGGVTYRWNGWQSAMAFISAYKLGSESALADFAYAIKHAEYVFLGTPGWRGTAENEPGGIPFGYHGDFCQTDVSDPVEYILQTSTITMALDQMWWFNYMGGGVGATIAFASLYTNNIYDDFLRYAHDYVSKKYGLAQAKPSVEVVKDIAYNVATHCTEQYDLNPIMPEVHWGGAIRAGLSALVAGEAVAMATGSGQAGYFGYEMATMLVKEKWSRLGWAGHEFLTGTGFANIYSLSTDEGVPMELRGLNYHWHSYLAISGSKALFPVSAHAARGDAWCLSPVVKVAFADPHLIFDFKNPRRSIAQGALHQFKPAGERNLISPVGQ